MRAIITSLLLAVAALGLRGDENTLLLAGTGAAGAPPATGPEEFDVSGATYYAVAPAGYSYSGTQDSNYSTRKYNTLSAAEAALSASPSAPQVINILGSWSAADTATVTFDGTTTTAANYTLVREISTARHNGAEDTTDAYRLVVDNAFNFALSVQDDHLRFDGFQIRQTGSGGTAAIDINSSSSQIVYVDNMLLFDTTGRGLRQRQGGTIVVRNSAATNCTLAGFEFEEGTTNYVYNTVALNNGGLGFSIDTFRTLIGKNCYSGGNTGADWGGGGTLTLTTCASEDGTGGSTISVAACEFVSTTTGSENLHLSATTSDLYAAGTNLNGDTYPVTRDIDYATRPATPSIGIDEP
jgi:hypothetical protein